MLEARWCDQYFVGAPLPFAQQAGAWSKGNDRTTSGKTVTWFVSGLFHLNVPGQHTAHQTSLKLGRRYMVEQRFPAFVEKFAVSRSDLVDSHHCAPSTIR